MDLSPVKQWIHRKRNKQFKRVTLAYACELKQVVAEETREQLAEIRDKSILIQIQDEKLEKLVGITIDRCSLEDAEVGDDIVLHQREKRNNKQVVASGFVLNISDEFIKIKFDRKFDLTKKNINKERKFELRFDVYPFIDRERKIERSLRKLNNFSRSLAIQKCLLGYYSDGANEKHGRARVVGLDGLQGPRGRHQSLAVTRSMRSRISLIEGVAGSGKTLIAANIACSSSRLRRCKVLLCSPIQATVDKLASLVSKAEGVKVVKLTDGSYRQERDRNKVLTQKKIKYQVRPKTAAAEIADYTLNELVNKAIYSIGWTSYRRAMKPRKLLDAQLHLQASRLMRNGSPWLRRKVEREILLKADVICCTIQQAGSERLKGLKFGMLIIDDAQMAREADCLIPMMLKGIKQVTLLSDMRRDIRLSRSISPSSEDGDKMSDESNRNSWTKTNSSSISDTASMRVKRLNSAKLIAAKSAKAKRRFRNSGSKYYVTNKPRQYIDVESNYLEPGGLFERWLSMGLATVALKHQFRMHETLAAFVNHHFYMSRLRTDSQANRQLTERVHNDQLIEATSFDWLPKRECLTAIFDTKTSSNYLCINKEVASIAKKLITKEGVERQNIGVITNVRPSPSSCLEIEDLEPKTVDDFVGQERDFIILACHDETHLQTDQNFIINDMALQIALTRARIGLFIVANLREVSKQIGETDKNGNLLPERSSSLKSTLSSQDEYCRSWKRLVDYYRKNQLVI